jgi:hypothetical protein
MQSLMRDGAFALQVRNEFRFVGLLAASARYVDVE